jgi:hypothetical protein
MTKPDVLKLLRAQLDPVLRDRGFRWKRMLRSSDGWYVRVWDGGRDTFGWGLASYFPAYDLGPFATLRVNAVEDLVGAHIPFSPREAAQEAFSINVNDVLAFVVGPDLRPGETVHRSDRRLESEEDVRSAASWLSDLISANIDPWWRSMRNARDLWEAPPAWRRFWATPTQMREAALAFLCCSVAEQERLDKEISATAASTPQMVRRWIESLLTDLQSRRRAAGPESP